MVMCHKNLFGKLSVGVIYKFSMGDVSAMCHLLLCTLTSRHLVTLSVILIVTLLVLRQVNIERSYFTLTKCIVCLNDVF